MDKFLIAPFITGLQTDRKPWLINDDAWAQLINSYTWRGRVRKRFGTSLMIPTTTPLPQFASLPSRLGLTVKQLVGMNYVPYVTAGGTVSGTVPGSIFEIGQSFSITYDILGVTTTILFTAYINLGGAQQMHRTDGSAAVATYNITNGDFNITGTGAPDGTTIKFYPAQPVMGISTYENNIPLFDDPVFAFDTQFAYQFGANGWDRIGDELLAPAAGIWSGGNLSFFWGTTWTGAIGSPPYFFVTNDNNADFMQYYDGTDWNILNPDVNAGGDNIITCTMIIPFRNRLLLLNTTESTGRYPNRLRYSALGDALGATSFYDTPVNTPYGGYVDNLQTQEEIIGAQFIKDRLIVFYEKSTWEVVYTGSEITPYVWQQLNTELGANSTFATVPFDKAVLTFGNVGIHSCNGSNVERIDNLIPQYIFDVQPAPLQGGSLRTQGIRDYFLEMAYWSFSSSDESDDISQTFPNRVLCYNYNTGGWSYNVDSFTAFGYFPAQAASVWLNSFNTWEETLKTWASSTAVSQFDQIIAGNQEGYVLVVDSTNTRNAPSLQITDIQYSPVVITLTIINHNITAVDTATNDAQYIVIENATGTGGIPNLNGMVFPLVNILTEDTFTIVNPFGASLTGVYNGGGTVARISNITMASKEFNPYADKGSNIYVQKVEYQVDATSSGKIQVDYYSSTSNLPMVNGASVTGTLIGTSTLDTFPYSTPPYDIYPLEATQRRLWHPVYFQSVGDFFQFKMYMSPEQMMNTDIAWSDFVLHSFTLFASPSGRLY